MSTDPHHWQHGRLVAETFDAKAPIGHSYGDVEYYTRHLAGVTGRILEVGSGTGRILLRLMESGLSIEGLEASTPMIDVCQANAADRKLAPTLHWADMIDFENPSRYAAIIVPAGAINALKTTAELEMALNRFRASLTPTGWLIIDLQVPQPLHFNAAPRLWNREANTWTITPVTSKFNSLENQLINVVRYDKWFKGLLVASELHEQCTTYWRPDAFAEILVKAGFIVDAITADYDDSTVPGSHNSDWTVHAHRAF